MKKILLGGILIFIILINPNKVKSITWYPTAGPKDTPIINLIVDPLDSNIIYAGTFGHGVFKSTDKGNSWFQINTNLPDLPDPLDTYILSMDLSNPMTLYVGTVGYGIFKTNNGGESWNPVNTGLTNLRVHMAPAIDPKNSSILYVGTERSVFKSINGGDSWSKSNNGLTGSEVCVIAIDPCNPSTIYAGTHYDSLKDGGVFKSINGGGLWTPINNGLPDPTTKDSEIHSLKIDPFDCQTLYAGTNGGIYKSTDGGQTWNHSNTDFTDLPIYGLSIHPQKPEIICAATFGGGVLCSENAGATWHSENLRLTYLFILDVVFDPLNPNFLYAGSFGLGVYKGLVVPIPNTGILMLLMD